MFYLKNSLCAEGRPCAPQGLASLVQSLCGCLVRLLVQKPCAEPCAGMLPRQPLFSEFKPPPGSIPFFFVVGSTTALRFTLLRCVYIYIYMFPKQLLAVRGPGGQEDVLEGGLVVPPPISATPIAICASESQKHLMK